MKTAQKFRNETLKRDRQLKQSFGTRVITDTNYERDTITLDGATGLGVPVPTPHPYISTDSWMRAMPNRRTGVKTIQSLTDYNDVIQGYYFPNRDELIKKYGEKRGLYRPLRGGEIELSSSGVAQLFLSSFGRYESRGGSVNSWLDDKLLESGAWAPTHIRRLHSHLSSKGIKDEERIGVATRPAENLETVKYPRVDGKFAKEYLRVINDGNDNPLIDHREGHVIDNSGAEVKNKYGNGLRYRKELYSKDGDKLTTQIDNQGNTEVSLPSSATEGMKIKIPSGPFNGTASDSFEFEAAGNKITMNSDGITMKSKWGTEFKMGLMGVTINDHYIVYKDFLTYFGSTHLPSTGIGFLGWPTIHSPVTISGFISNSIPGKIASDLA